MNLNKLREIIWGGITGMLLLSGTYIGLIIATAYAGNLLPASGSIIQKFFGMNKWTFEEIHTVFIIAASVGVIVGIIAGWRCPQVCQKLFVPAAVIGIPAILVGWFFYAYAIRVEVPHKIKLADCTNSPVKIHLETPKGRKYFLTLNTPKAQTVTNGGSASPYAFTGYIQITKGNVVIADIPIESDKTSVNLIQNADGSCEYQLPAFSRDTNAPSLSRFIQAGGDYDFEVKLNPAPPTASSIWLHWLQTAKDREN